VVVAGRYRGDDLVIVGRTVPLSTGQSTELGDAPSRSRRTSLAGEISSQRWGGRDAKKPLPKVRPDVVVEVSADAAIQAGQWRHPLRLVRYRAELQPEDVPTLPDTGENG